MTKQQGTPRARRSLAPRRPYRVVAGREQPAHSPALGEPAWPVSVVLADSHPAVRHGVRFVLESAGVSVVGEAATADEALAEVVRQRPQVLVVDGELEHTSGVRVIAQVLRMVPDTGVLVFSAVDDDAAIAAALIAGARGYLTKSARPDQILRGIHAVAAGEAIVGGTVAGRLSGLVRPAMEHRHPFPQLSAREREVLDCMAAGKSNAAIARQLMLAPKTISNRVSDIFGKLGVSDRMQAILLARDAGLGAATPS